jgi:hypothetical protein
MWTRTVQTAVNCCRFAKRGSADGQIVPASDGSAPCFPVFGEIPDADLQIAEGKTVAIVTDDDDREIFLIAGNTVTEFQFLTSDTNAAAVPANDGDCVGAQALQSGIAGDIIKCRPAQGNLYVKSS